MSITLILLLFLSIITLSFAYDASRIYGYIGGKLVVSTSINMEYDETGNTLITIAGRVIDESNKTVPKASMSIQVADPLGSTAHIALVYSKSDGTFLNEFIMKGDYLPHILNNGVSGSGKSTFLVNLALRYIERGYTVIWRELGKYDILTRFMNTQDIIDWYESEHYTGDDREKHIRFCNSHWSLHVIYPCRAYCTHRCCIR